MCGRGDVEQLTSDVIGISYPNIESPFEFLCPNFLLLCIGIIIVTEAKEWNCNEGIILLRIDKNT